jgi:hypothetical protein
MRFSLDIAIHQVVNEIKEKLGFDGSDHGLFQPAVSGKSKARWFQENRSLRFYSLVQDVQFLFSALFTLPGGGRVSQEAQSSALRIDRWNCQNLSH